jgi:maltose-binding protein MalE
MEAIALYYNRELVPEPPATWEELKQIARDLQEAGTVEQAYYLQQGDPYHSYPILSGHGGYIFGRDAQDNYDPTDVGLDTPGGLAYGAELESMIQEGLLRADVDYGAAEIAFHGGEAAMWITGPWALPGMRDSGVDFGVAPIPSMEQDARPFVGVQGFMINSFSPNQLLAETFFALRRHPHPPSAAVRLAAKDLPGLLRGDAIDSPALRTLDFHRAPLGVMDLHVSK